MSTFMSTWHVDMLFYEKYNLSVRLMSYVLDMSLLDTSAKRKIQTSIYYYTPEYGSKLMLSSRMKSKISYDKRRGLSYSFLYE